MRKLTPYLLLSLAFLVMGDVRAEEPSPGVGFKTHRIGDYRGEACGAGDFNKDGKLDIVALPFLYLAPEFKATKICEIAGEVDNEGKGYRDDFMNAPFDVDGDGWLDVITVTWFAKKAEWLRNPGEAGGPWPRVLIAEAGNFEAGSLCDVDGDGKVDDILPDTQDTAWYEHRDGAFIKHVVSAKPMTWGVGCGDVNGDGRPDIVRPEAWFEGPADPSSQEWKEHPLDLVNRDKTIPDVANILVHDVNGDGLADLIASAAHDYGIYWYEQARQDGAITFKRHLIDDSWSQVHSMTMADLDNDGALELIAAKRFMAHNGTDPGEMEPPCVYWYDLAQKPEVVWTRHTVSEKEGIGSGLNIATADIDGDGDQDIVVTGKWGGPAWFENTLK
ncbi:MAG: VCBS repeat-containing protein [FCB group bacterium]|nr:VCBS repeat-containing protein [FCB group bacterium]